MRHLLLVALLVILTTSALPQNANVARTTAPAPLPAKTTLRARVYYEDIGRPVRRMSVMLMSRSGMPGETGGVTDALGNLEVKNVRAGTYYAIVNAPGVVTPFAFIDLRTLLYDGRGDIFSQLDGLPTIEVNGLTNVNVEIPAKRGASVTGRIVYADGDPAIGVKVEILRKVGDEFVPTLPGFASAMTAAMGLGGAQTDDRGVYRFSGLPAGEYIVKVTENVVHAESKGRGATMGAFILGPAASMVSIFFENAMRSEDAVPLKLQLGQEVPEVNIVIPERPMRSIRGKVIAAKDKLPIRGARLTIKRVGETTGFEFPEDIRGELGAQTDSEGRFEFRELPKGKYVVVVKPGSSEFDRKAQAYGEAEDPDEDPTLKANRAVTNAMKAANAAIEDARGIRRPSKVLPPPFSPASKEFVIEDEDLGEQIVELSPGATITGTIASQDNSGISGSVTITARSSDGLVDRSDSISFHDYLEEEEKVVQVGQKDFRLAGISTGKNLFMITTTDDDYYVKSAASNQVDLLAGPIELKSGETLANIRIVVANDTGTVKGKIIDDEKRPIANRLINFVPTDKAKAKTATFDREIRTDANGEFEIRLPPFEYAIIFKPKTASKILDSKWLDAALRDAEKVQIDPGKTSTVRIKRNAKD